MSHMSAACPLVVEVDPDSAATASTENCESQVEAISVKKKRGRPKGSKSKAKGADAAKKPKKSASQGSKSKSIDAGVPSKKSTSQKSTKAKPRRKKLSMKAVNEILKAHGAEIRKVSRCLRAGILNNNVKLLKPEDDPDNEYGLDQTLMEGECFVCGEEITCTIRDVLYQPDYGGMDYESGAEYATLRCPGEECGGVYVTGICYGDPAYDSGKFHNHCTECPAFGTCLGDYREAHCPICGDHYFMAGFRGKCYNCYPNYDPLASSDDDSDDEDGLPRDCSLM